MFMAAICFVGMNAATRLDSGFIKKCQQRLAVMTNGPSGSTAALNHMRQPWCAAYNQTTIGCPFSVEKYSVHIITSIDNKNMCVLIHFGKQGN